MTSKITLYSDEKLIKEIKRYAKAHNTSVSKIVNQFFKHLLQSENTPKAHPQSTITDSLSGILKESKKEDYRKYIEDKYL